MKTEAVSQKNEKNWGFFGLAKGSGLQRAQRPHTLSL